jgi:predicted nucleotidyltransferase
MQKNLLKYLKSICKCFSNKGIFDIVVYGSSVKSKEIPRDLDVAVIFLKENLNTRLKIAQELKTVIKKEVENPDVKAINITELFDKNFLARQGILTEGYSLLSNEPFSYKIGFKGYVLFTYSLKKLSHNEKTKFTYALSGRNSQGIVKNVDAIVLGKGAFAVPTEKSIFFEDFLKKWDVDYKIKQTLISI